MENYITREGLIRAWERNGWKDVTVTCPDGARATVAPCVYVEPKCLKNCEYFLIYWDIPSWGGEDNIDKLVKTLNRHAELKADNESSEDQLREFFNEHQRNGWDDESFSTYSDWHKDVFGYRPHGYVFGQYVNPHKPKVRYSEEELIAFVNRADSTEKCQIALEYIEKLTYIDGKTKKRLTDMLCDIAEQFDDPEDDYDDYEDRGSYSPSAPWNAPGMKVSDFISGVYY